MDAKLFLKLAEPFGPDEVEFKPMAVSGNRALPAAYIDARAVMNRLDAVLGVGGWRDEYDVLPDGNVICRLSIHDGDRWLTKCDVGGPSEQPDGGDRLKAAFSDALKRAAVKFGIGRYLYSLQLGWADYDPQKRKFVQPITLPSWALPQANPGPAYWKSLLAHEATLVAKGILKPKEISTWVLEQCRESACSDNPEDWDATLIATIKDLCKSYMDGKKPAPVKAAK